MGISKAGPCGGENGNVKDIKPENFKRITKMIIGHSDAIDSIYFAYENNNGSQDDNKTWGGKGGQKTQLYFAPDEFIKNVSGHYATFKYGNNKSFVVLRSLKIETNHHNGVGAYGPFGKEVGVAFNLPAFGGKIIGFHARAGTYVDALGVYVQHA